MPDTPRPGITPLDCALEALAEAEKALGAQISEIIQLSFTDALIAVHPGIKTVFPEPGSVYFEVDMSAANSIAIAAHGNPESLEVLVHIATSNIWNGQPVPRPFRPICFELLNGKKVGARKSGPKTGKDFEFFYLATRTADHLADAYKIPRTRGDGMKPDSAADIMVEPFAERGNYVEYIRVRDWITHSKHKNKRVRADIIAHRINENILIELGIVSGRDRWHIGPYSPYGPSPIIGRMT